MKKENVLKELAEIQSLILKAQAKLEALEAKLTEEVRTRESSEEDEEDDGRTDTGNI